MSAAGAEVDRLARLRADQRNLEASRERLRQQGRQLRELLDAAKGRAAQLRHAAKSHNADRDEGRIAAAMVAAARERTRAQQARYAQLEAAFDRARERARDAADDAAARRTASREVLAMEAIRVDKRETRLLGTADEAQDELSAAQAALAAVRARVEDADEVATEAAALRRSWGRVLQAAQAGVDKPASALQAELVKRTEDGHREQTAMRLALDRATADLSALKLGEAAVRGQLEATSDHERALHTATASAAADAAAAPHPLLSALPARLVAEAVSDPSQASLPAAATAETADGCVSAEAKAALTGSQRRSLVAAVAAAAAAAASLRVPGLAAARDAAEERGRAAPVAPILAVALNPASAQPSSATSPRKCADATAANHRPAWLSAALGQEPPDGTPHLADGSAESKGSADGAGGGAAGVRFRLAELDDEELGAAYAFGDDDEEDEDDDADGPGAGGAEWLAADLVAARIREAMAEAAPVAGVGVAPDAAPAAPVVGGTTRDRRRLAPGRSSRRGTYFGAFKASGSDGHSGGHVLMPLPEPGAASPGKDPDASPPPRSSRRLIVEARRREAAALRALNAKSAPGLNGTGTFGSTGRPEDPWASFPRPSNARSVQQQAATAAKSPLKQFGSAGRAGQRSSPVQSPASAGTAQGRRLRRESVSRVATYIHADTTERSLMAAVATRTITRKEAQDLKSGASAVELEQQRAQAGRKPASSWKRGSFFGAFKGKTALVTGSSSGIGLGIASVLASKGANVVVHGVGTMDEIDRVAQAIADKHDVKCAASNANLLMGEEPVKAMVELSQATFDRPIDILVNNAGIQHVCPVEDFSLEAWERIMAVNLTAAFLATREVLPAMRENAWGRVVNIASVHGVVASANKSAYVAAKHGLIGFTKAIALETANSGITSNAIKPGWVLTPLVEAQIAARAAASGRSFEEEQDDMLREKQPQRQFATPEDLGELTAFLCSQAAANMTGESIAMDGGWTAQ